MMMKILLATCAIVTSAAALSADVGVSVTVGQPGFYGRIDIGNVPRPVLVHSRPIVVAPAPAAVVQQPIYLRVPPGHARKWAKHCAQYNACGQPVYFVQDNWYRNVYVPHYQQRHGERMDGDRKGKHQDKGRDRD